MIGISITYPIKFSCWSWNGYSEKLNAEEDQLIVGNSAIVKVKKV